MTERTAVCEVQTLLRQRISPLSAELLDPVSAAARVLAEDVTSPVNVPDFARAAMDGFAVRANEQDQLLSLIGQVKPANPLVGSVQNGQTVRVLTGAPLPEGTDTIVPQEFADESSGVVRILRQFPKGKNVGQVGEDVRAGEIILKAGRVLRPQDIALVVSVGLRTIAVRRRPRVALFATGNELLPPGSPLRTHHIIDSNSPMLAALISSDGGVPEPARILPDDCDTIREAIVTTASEVILISGGSSVGQEDYAPDVVRRLGDLAVHGVALRPGGPAGVGFVNGKVVFLLPGNPVSCLVAYDLFAGLAIRRLGGYTDDLPYESITLPLARSFQSAMGRTDYVRVRISQGQAEPLAGGASALSTITRADGFLLVPPEREILNASELVRVFLYDRRRISG